MPVMRSRGPLRGGHEADLPFPALATILAEFLTELDLHQVAVV